MLEDRRPQAISFFNSQDAPVTVGLVIDSSGSMAPNRTMVIAASMAFTKAMNPQDEFFVMGFNEHIHTPLPSEKPFTNSEPALRVALVQAIKARGQTAIYDALHAALDYVQKGGFERQVLIVLSDGGDNASSTTRAQVLANAQGSNAVIYTIALVDPMDSEADPGFLEAVVRVDRRSRVQAEERRRNRKYSPGRCARHPQHVHHRIRPIGRSCSAQGAAPTRSR